MKKSLSITLATGLVLFSCVKPEQQVGVGGAEAQDGGMDYIIAAGPGTCVKTVVNDGTKVLWTDGDQIGMYAGNSATALYNTILAEPSAQAKFGRISDSTPVKADNQYYAVYPSSAVAQWGAPEDTEDGAKPFCYVSIPKQQVAVKGSWDKNAAVLAASSQTEQFAFKHAVSYLRFETTEQTGDFVAVRLSAVKGEMLSDSQAGVQYLPSGELEVIPSISATPNVSLTNAENSAVFEAGAYYMTFLPGEFTGGLTLTFTNAENQVAEKSIGALTLEPGEVADWGTIGELSFGEAIIPLEKLSVVEENGVKGVVFWVDDTKPDTGKIISGPAAKLTWGTSSATTYTWSKNIDTDNGAANHKYVLDVEGADAKTYPAVYFCEGLGEGWRLPTVGEIDELIKTYYGLDGSPETEAIYYGIEPYSKNASDFDAVLAECVTDDPKTADMDETKIAMSSNSWYWTGQGDASNSKIRRVKLATSYLSSSANAKNSCYVRCVREVSTKQ